MPYVSGWLIEGADPGYGNRPGGGGYPDNALPGGQPGIDNSLPPGVPPIGSTLPEPPPGIWPPPSFTRPIVPVEPDQGLPVTPGTIWPPPARPGHDLPGGGGGQIDNSLPSKTYWVVAGIPGIGWRYVAVDPSLVVGHPLPPAPQPK